MKCSGGYYMIPQHPNNLSSEEITIVLLYSLLGNGRWEHNINETKTLRNREKKIPSLLRGKK
jgi:hypothetical protein